ncbi:hypothetical protein ACFC34_38020 [Streptomyces sp. NPDC056053]|uniref:hypothetical protein n=1 Tax=Streptomyces sp. NPDC056053 TaxID=3345696 RepID=UPI0035DE784B
MEAQEWVNLWHRDAELETESERRLISDVCGGIRMVADDGPDDPEDVIAVAIAGAEAAEATAFGLDYDWALYTPQQAAVVASALFAQIEAAGLALERLGEYLHVMDARQDVEMPEFDGHEDLNLSNAEMLLGCAGQEARAAACRAEDVVRVLAETPYLGTLPENAHETITALAKLLGTEATLNTDHHIRDEAELAKNYENGFGCGCSITLHDDNGSQWQFQRGDSTWNLLRMEDIDEDGILQSWTELDTIDAHAHPEHVATLIRQELSTPLDESTPTGIGTF